jgi:hypothetical protein
MFKNIYIYLPVVVEAQSNPKLSYFEHVRNFSDIFQSINNITMVTTHNNQILYESYKKHFQDKVLDIY